MTPECHPCGFAVEWVRSCYRSRWRLFRDPTIETPGRYVFVPGVPAFLPFPHPYWSRNWTTADERGSYALGEVDGLPRPYDKGTAPSLPVPVLRIGSVPCIQSGSTLSLPVLSVPLASGFPVACWTAAGLLPPPDSALLWLRPDEIQGYVAGQPISVWPDAGKYGHDGLQYTAVSQGLPDTNGLAVADVIVGTHSSMTALEPVVIPGDYAVYLVANVGRLGFIASTLTVLTQGPQPAYPLRVVGPQISCRAPGRDPVVQAIPDQSNVLAIYSVRRLAGSVVFGLNATVYPPQADPGASAPYSSASVLPVLTAVPAAPSNVYELRLLGGQVPDVSHQAIVAQLNARYHAF